jgi:hypothetical protein
LEVPYQLIQQQQERQLIQQQQERQLIQQQQERQLIQQQQERQLIQQVYHSITTLPDHISNYSYEILSFYNTLVEIQETQPANRWCHIGTAEPRVMMKSNRIAANERSYG